MVKSEDTQNLDQPTKVKRKRNIEHTHYTEIDLT